MAPYAGYKPVVFSSPFMRLVEVGWSSKLWMVVVVSGTVIEPHEGGGGIFGTFKAEFDVEDDPVGKADYDGNPGYPDWDNPFAILPTTHLFARDVKEQRYLLHILKSPRHKKGIRPDVAISMRMFGQWSTLDIPGLPIEATSSPTYKLYMFRSTAEATEENEPYHLRIKDSVKKKRPALMLEPFDTIEFNASTVKQEHDPGEDVTFGFADIRLLKLNAQGKPFRDDKGKVIPVKLDVTLRKN